MNIRIIFIAIMTFSLFCSVAMQEITSFSSIRIISTLIAFIFMVIILITKKVTILKYNLIIIIYTIILLTFSVFFVWDKLFSINMYLSVITASMIYIIDKRRFLQFLKITLFLQVGLQFYEYFTESYIYEITANYYGNEAVLSYKSMVNFRGKGLFEGPLTASAFAIYLAFIFKNDTRILGIVFISSLLTNTRLSMLTISLIIGLVLIQKLIQKNKINEKFLLKLFIMIISLLISIVILYVFIFPLIFDSSTLERMSQTFNTESGSNQLRMYYWALGINLLFEYDIIHLLFGNSFYFSSLYGNSAESDWLMILLELGFFGFILYLTPFIFIIHTLFKRKEFIEGILFLILMLDIFLYRQISGSGTNVLHWFLILITIEKIYKRKKNEKSTNT